MEVYATTGVVLNGFLLWLDIQRQIKPENLWKEQAVQRFFKEEITDAKEILWRTAGDSIIGKKILRKGTTKMVSEVNDICTALKLLSEKESTMVSQTPMAQPVEGDNSEVNEKMKEIEESLSSLVTASGHRGPASSEDSSKTGHRYKLGLILGLILLLET